MASNSGNPSLLLSWNKDEEHFTLYDSEGFLLSTNNLYIVSVILKDIEARFGPGTFRLHFSSLLPLSDPDLSLRLFHWRLAHDEEYRIQIEDINWKNDPGFMYRTKKPSTIASMLSDL